MKQTKRKIFNYNDRLIYVTGEILTDEHGQIIERYPDFIHDGDEFVPYAKLEEDGEEIDRQT